MKPELLDPVEWKSITESIDGEFGEGVTSKLLGERTPIALVGEDLRYIYLIPVSWVSILLEGTPEGYEYQLIGKQLGVMSKDRFRLSLQILQDLVKLTAKKIIVSKKAAEAFTYGRSILKESVVRIDDNLRRGQRVLVLNENHECLGIAALSIDSEKFDRLSGDKLVGKNLVDIGWFIRRLG
ncbi:hypothetical protein EU527_14825 [Candidatus Thorarchaeota archaeon]|nr:MAG: hypothetical protein EU527_14825 [Candidatus Thorarchaeota archaeon]